MHSFIRLMSFFFVAIGTVAIVYAEPPTNGPDSSGLDAAGPAAEDRSPPGFAPPPSDFRQLAPDQKVWLSKKRGVIVIDGAVALRQGALEMFACPTRTKEHESVVAVDARPFVVHAGLLLLTGGEQGTPVRFQPEYQPATGPVVEIFVLWRDKDGTKRHARAQEWVRNAHTGKQLDHPWVFAGSDFWTNQTTGERHYLGDTGDFICVSNFPSATLDLPVESSQANAGLLFEAFTERIPPSGTPVRLILWPKVDAKKAAAARTNPGEDAGAKQPDP